MSEIDNLANLILEVRFKKIKITIDSGIETLIRKTYSEFDKFTVRVKFY